LICDALAYYYLRNRFRSKCLRRSRSFPHHGKSKSLPRTFSYTSLRTGQEGLYTEQQMEPVDYTCRLRYFEKAGDKYKVKPQLKELVRRGKNSVFKL